MANIEKQIDTNANFSKKDILNLTEDIRPPDCPYRNRVVRLFLETPILENIVGYGLEAHKLKGGLYIICDTASIICGKNQRDCPSANTTKKVADFTIETRQ